MDTRADKTRLGLLLAIMVAALLPASASAGGEYLVPPDNSAAVQYTEAYPTAGGNKGSEDGSPARHRSPSQTLGSHNLRRLQAKGPEGEAAAQLAAATAPAPLAGGGNHTQASSRVNRGPQSSRPAASDATSGRVPGSRSEGGGVSGSPGFGAAVGEVFGLSAHGSSPLVLIGFLGALAWLLVETALRRKRRAS